VSPKGRLDEGNLYTPRMNTRCSVLLLLMMMTIQMMGKTCLLLRTDHLPTQHNVFFFVFVYGNVLIVEFQRDKRVSKTPSPSLSYCLASFVRRLKSRRRQSPCSWYGRANRLYSVFSGYLSLCSLAWSSMAVLQLPSIRVLYVLRKQKDDAWLPCSKRSMV